MRNCLNAIAIVVLVLLAAVAQAAPLRVTLLLAEEGAAYREFAQSFTAEAAGQDASLSISQATSPPPDAGLIVAVGIKSFALALNGGTPVLAVLVSKAGIDSLLHELPEQRAKNSYTAIYLDQPSRRQIDLVAAALPEAKNLGLLYSKQMTDIADLRKAVAQRGLTLHEQKFESVESLHRDLQFLLQKIDVLIAIPDAAVYNSSTIRNILIDTYRSNDPVVGFSPSYVKAGALCAVFSTPQQIATQAILVTRKFAESGQLPAAQYPNEFEVLINRQVARSLGIRIDEPGALAQQIKAAAGGGK